MDNIENIVQWYTEEYDQDSVMTTEDYSKLYGPLMRLFKHLPVLPMQRIYVVVGEIIVETAAETVEIVVDRETTRTAVRAGIDGKLYEIFGRTRKELADSIFGKRIVPEYAGKWEPGDHAYFLDNGHIRDGIISRIIVRATNKGTSVTYSVLAKANPYVVKKPFANVDEVRRYIEGGRNGL